MKKMKEPTMKEVTKNRGTKTDEVLRNKTKKRRQFNHNWVEAEEEIQQAYRKEMK